MKASDILDIIKEETKKTVIIQWNKNGATGNKTNAVTSECWAMTVTDSPDSYFENLNQKYKNRATHCSKFAISSFSHGVELYNELCNYFNSEVGPTPIEESHDPSKQLYLAIHIHYHIQ